MKHRIVFLILLIIVLQPMYVFAQWQATTGLFGGSVADIDEYNSKVYVSTSNGLFVSSDLGNSWTISLRDQFISSLEITAEGFYATIYGGGVVKSTDGISWSTINNGITNSYSNSIIKISNNLFLGTNSGGIFRSSNNGSLWTSKSNGLPASSTITDFEISGATIYAGTWSGVYYSTDLGENWNKLSASPNGVLNLLIVNNYFFASTMNYVYVSNDAGVNWSPSNSGSFPFNSSTHSKGQLRYFNNTLYAASDAGVYSSTNNGTSFTKLTTGSSYHFQTIYPLSATRLLTGAVGEGILLSTDGGNTWNKSNQGLTAIYYKELYSDNTIFLAGTFESGIYYSNNGSNWIQAKDNLPNYSVNTFTKNSSYYFAGTGLAGVLRSADGISWVGLNNYLKDIHIEQLISSGDTVFAATISGVHYSINNGVSWTQMTNNGLTDTYVNCILRHNDDIYVGTWSAGIFRINRNGSSWTQVNNGITSTPLRVTKLEISGNTLFAIAGYSNLYSSSNNGGNWINKNQNINDIYTKGNVVLTIGYKKFYSTMDEGLTWELIPTITEPGDNLIAYANGTIYAGGYSGTIWKNSKLLNVIVPNSTSNSTIEILRNPIQDLLKVEIEMKRSGECHMSILNQWGVKVKDLPNENYAEGIYSKEFSVADLSPGIYFLKMLANGEVYTLKFIVM